MSSDVVLTAALRNNLLSLQNTQSLIDKTQLRLATGLKVNSALDNPGNFFAAQSLDNRAGDLTRLLDGIGQSIKTIEAANNGVTGLTKLVEQAQSIVSSARDELAASQGEARLVGSVDLSNVADITAGAFGTAGITNGDTFSITTVSDSGAQISETITIVTGDSAYSLAAKITDQFADSRDGEITARITDDGFLEIASTEGRSFKIQDGATGISLAGFTALGIGDAFEDQTRNATTLAATTVVAGNTLKSISLYEASGNTLDAGDTVVGSTGLDADGNTVLGGLLAGDSFTFTVNNSGTITSGAVTLTATTTFQDVVDQINQTAAINEYIEADFDTATGQISFTSLSDTVDNLQIVLTTGATAGTRTFDIGLGDPAGTLDPISAATVSVPYDSVFSFNNSTESLDSLARDYNSIREQINTLVSDAQYRGVNLLDSDDLTTFFNEDNSSRLTTSGVNFSADGLGITEATFRGTDDIELSASQARDALTAVRNFGSSLANNLAIIQTRQDFTNNTINTLKAGADALTVADQNEEGANLLALQTRQTLGVTSLSLASQSQQAVLRLF